MFVRFAKDGLPKIETINIYGASSHPESNHFNDPGRNIFITNNKTDDAE